MESYTFREIGPCTNNIVYAKFEDFITFLYVFMKVLGLRTADHFRAFGVRVGR